MSRKRLLSVTGFLLIVLAFLFPAKAFSAFDFSYSLTEGGTRLEFDSATIDRGVRISVTSDVAKRYEVIQKVVRRIENRDRPGNVIDDNLVMRGLRGTNRFGTLHVLTNDTPVRDYELLYTSNTAGDADTFTLVYGIENIENIVPGYYQGEISYTLRSIGGAQNEVTKYVYVYVVVSPTDGGKPRVEIKTSTGSRTLLLNPKHEEKKIADLLVTINGVFKNLFSISQFIRQPLESLEGHRLQFDSVQVSTAQVKKGVGTTRLPLSNQPQLLYTSLPNGETDDSFVISYVLADLAPQQAGRYRCPIDFYIDELGMQSKLETIELIIEIERVFELLLTPAEQKGTIEFRNLKPKDPPQVNEVVIEIKTNIGRQYQVSQKVLSELTNQEGDIIPAEYFTVRAEPLDKETGVIRCVENTGVGKGEQLLFVSDKKGSPVKFKLVYELVCPEGAGGGDYGTRITYSLIEL